MLGAAAGCTIGTWTAGAEPELSGLAVQAIGATALWLVFAALAWQPAPARGARLWAFAHASFACAALALVARLLLWPPAEPTSWHFEGSPAVRSLYALHVGARTVGLWLLFAGVRTHARAVLRTRTLAWGALTAGLLSGVAGWFAKDQAAVLALEAPLGALGFAAVAVALAVLPPPSRCGASRATALALALLSALWAASTVALTTDIAPPGSRLAALLAYAPHADLTMCLLVALGLVALLRRAQLAEARESAERLAALEQRLAQAQRMEAVGMIVSGVAHELNSPLSAILGFTEPSAGKEPLATNANALRIVHEQAQRCKAIVGELLTFAGSREERWEELEMRELVARVLDGLRGDVAARDIALELVDGEPVVMRGDAIGLQQVLTNLVQNAAQAIGSGGCVRIFVHCDDEHAELVVEDDGPGVAPELKDRIFEPFFTTKAAEHGSGLGLTISHGIVRTHGGTLKVESLAAPRHGARFVARLPLHTSGPVAATPWPRLASRAGPASWLRMHRPAVPVAAAPPHAAPAQAAPTQAARALTPEPDGLPVHELSPRPPAATRVHPAPAPAPAPRADGARRICVIEDDPAVLLLLRAVFERERWHVESFADSRDAVALLRGGARFDAIVSDVQMPYLSGLELFEILANERPELVARLVLVTGDQWLAELAPLRESGACAILPKPLDLQALVDACNQRCAA